MEDKFQRKYRISSPRLSGWDYGSHGLYFVTICTKDSVHYFGEIKPAETTNTELQNIALMQTTDIGKIAHANWLQMPIHYPYIELDEFIIMPDHIHGIIFIDKPNKTTWEVNKFGVQRDNLAAVIRAYKSSVKKYATDNSMEFSWQPRYYDRVIRNEKEHINIRGYIYGNPENWLLNKDNFENLFIP